MEQKMSFNTICKLEVWFAVFCMMFLLLAGCGEDAEEITKVRDLDYTVVAEEITKVRDLDYTVVAEADLPEPLLELINKKKANPFCFTYDGSGDARSICQGLGAQMTSGYSVVVEGLFLGERATYINNLLLEPGKDELVIENTTYPYIVVKIEDTEYNVVNVVFDFEDMSTKYKDDNGDYRAGVYTSAVALGDSEIELEIVLDSDHINSIRFVNMEESGAATMYPLMEPALQELTEQLTDDIAPEDVVWNENFKYTQMLLMEVINAILEKAAVE